MEEKRHGGAGRVIVVILILAVLLAAGAFFLFGGRVRVETPSFSTGYRYDRAKDYATLDTFPVEGVTADKVELHWISGRVEIRAAERAFESGKGASPARSFAKKMRVPVFLLLLALGALGVAIGLSKNVLGYLLLLPDLPQAGETVRRKDCRLRQHPKDRPLVHVKLFV